MDELRVFLFGKFRIESGGMPLKGIEARKVQELFAYLLLNRNRPHAREPLAALLWPRHSTEQSRCYLRRVLWQLKTELEEQTDIDQPLLVDPEWIEINSSAALWVDAAILEEAYHQTKDDNGQDLDCACARQLQFAVRLYQSDLLEGWYHDWCVFERERLQHIYLNILEKLLRYATSVGDYEAGLEYGRRILLIDHAREYTHRQLMRLQYLSGDRTGALRQYKRCTAALNEEFGVNPAKRTNMLYDQILAERLKKPTETTPEIDLASSPSKASVHQLLTQLRKMQDNLDAIQTQLKEGIETVTLILDR